jgi:uncharacterized protein (DUF1800 family)
MTSLSAEQRALIAFHRFGLGAKPGGIARMGSAARAALCAELNTPKIAAMHNSSLPTYEKACSESQMGFDRAEALRQTELNARVDKHMSVEIGFVERLVIFWSNHFCMSVDKTEAVRGTIGQWERDVIRRNVLGRFSDMLRGTIRHPAMIAYLDNDTSLGPNSPIGQQWGTGFNENLAREILELHTVGSGGGYREVDVTAFAKMLTGWSYVRGWEADSGSGGGTPHNRGQFIYRANWHEPGSYTLMGKTYSAPGQQLVIDALDDLALHPATAEHIAFKLVRHFITDTPTRQMVDPIKQKFLQTGGNLKAVALALIDLPAAWSMPFTKLRTPYEYSIAKYRALGMRYRNSDSWVLSEPLCALNQMPWEARSPEGYSDETPVWLNPDAMRVRANVARFVSWKLLPNTARNVPALADSLFRSTLSPATRSRLVSAASSNEALIILFSSPEFQRR